MVAVLYCPCLAVQVEGVEQEADTLKDLYELMEKYLVPIPPEDQAVYHTLKPAVNGLRNSVDKGVGQRDQYISKFCRMLDKDIIELGKDVKAIKNEAQVPSSSPFAGNFLDSCRLWHCTLFISHGNNHRA